MKPAVNNPKCKCGHGVAQHYKNAKECRSPDCECPAFRLAIAGVKDAVLHKHPQTGKWTASYAGFKTEPCDSIAKVMDALEKLVKRMQEVN